MPQRRQQRGKTLHIPSRNEEGVSWTLQSMVFFDQRLYSFIEFDVVDSSGCVDELDGDSVGEK